jgi:chaperone BCS1
MATYNDNFSLPRQPLSSLPSYPISIVDILFPGLTNGAAAFHQLQSGDSNSYAGMLCICGILVFFGRYAYKYLRDFVTVFFSSYRTISLVTLSDN